MSIRKWFTTISRRSWHYRLVTKVNELFGEQKKLSSACHYWCVELPSCLFAVAFFGGWAVLIGLGAAFMVGLGLWEAVHHPLAALEDFGLVMALSIATTLLAFLGVYAQKVVNRHCPSLKITD